MSEQIGAFLRENEMSTDDLAEALNISKNYAYQVATGRRAVSDGFRYKFAARFGWAAARRVLTEHRQERELQRA